MNATMKLVQKNNSAIEVAMQGGGLHFKKSIP